MNNISVSFHIGSSKHNINTIQDLKRTSNHNMRKFRNNDDTKDSNVLLIGSDNLYNDIKDMYDKLFKDEQIRRDSLKSKTRDKYGDYLNFISNSKNKQVAVEMIIQLGDIDFNFNNASKSEISNNLIKLTNLILNKFPNFKVANAVIHFDESTPHIHCVGVPIKENTNSNKMKYEVSKSQVFTKERLENCWDEIFKTEFTYNGLTFQPVKQERDIERKNMTVGEYKTYKKQLDIKNKLINVDIVNNSVNHFLKNNNIHTSYDLINNDSLINTEYFITCKASIDKYRDKPTSIQYGKIQNDFKQDRYLAINNYQQLLKSLKDGRTIKDYSKNLFMIDIDKYKTNLDSLGLSSYLDKIDSSLLPNFIYETFSSRKESEKIKSFRLGYVFDKDLTKEDRINFSNYFEYKTNIKIDKALTRITQVVSGTNKDIEKISNKVINYESFKTKVLNVINKIKVSFKEKSIFNNIFKRKEKEVEHYDFYDLEYVETYKEFRDKINIILNDTSDKRLSYDLAFALYCANFSSNDRKKMILNKCSLDTQKKLLDIEKPETLFFKSIDINSKLGEYFKRIYDFNYSQFKRKNNDFSM